MFFCIDVDECNDTGACQQVCINTPGSFACDCQPGYELSGATDCVGMHTLPILVGWLIGEPMYSQMLMSVCWDWTTVDSCASTQKAHSHALVNLVLSWMMTASHAKVKFFSTYTRHICIILLALFSVLQPCQANALPCDNGQCVVVDNAPTCACDRGYMLHSNGQTCIGTLVWRNIHCAEL